MDEFPWLELTEALMCRRFDLGLSVWNKLKDAMQEGIVKIPELARLPFDAPEGVAETARNDILQDAINEQEIAEIARHASKHERTAWLIEKALNLARSGEATSLAMSLMLLGFAHTSQELDAAWSEIDALVPRGGWLEDVYRLSRHAYDRNC